MVPSPERSTFAGGVGVGWRLKQRAGTAVLPCPRGRQIVSLKDTAEHIQKRPKAEQDLEEWQAVVEAPLPVVELNGPTMMARIGEH